MKHLTAVIREAECIGCTKCIQACPVDAIMGAAKQMHSVITSECTGCEFCISPCPVDCIDMVPLENIARPEQYHARATARQTRLADEQRKKQKKHLTQIKSTTLEDKKDYIAAAIARSKAKS